MMLPCCPKCLIILYVTDKIMACLHCNLRFDNTPENVQKLLNTTERAGLIKMKQEFVKTGKWSEWPNDGSKKL